MKIIEALINKGEWLLDALKRIGFNMIPSNTILDKTLTGLGATHSEIHSKRNSIIIEPSVPVILGKLNDNDDMEAVYAKCEPYNLKKYLSNNDIKYKKIITTPESFHKIRKAAEELNINIYKTFFCLFDECEKITQDIDYRRKIAQPIYDFFQFEEKAFVSATPLPISNPEFEKQNFQKIKIVPTYDYKKNLELIVTNSYYKRVKIVLDSLKDSKHICIFFNVTDGINELIYNLGITDYKVFCSEKSVEKLNQRGIDKAYSNINTPLAKHNFFTCRFYSAVDIKLRNKPDVIMLTDLRGAKFTMIDPLTEAIQIQGRFRKKGNDEITYNSLTHITTVNPDMEVMSREQILKRLNRLKVNYDKLKQDYDSEEDEDDKEAILEDLDGLKFNDLKDDNGKINSFSIDNIYNEQRVKSYYLSAESLYRGYLESNYFNITLNDVTECVGEDDIEKLNHTKLEIEKRRMMVKFLEKINNDFNNDSISYKDKEDYLDFIKRQPNASYTIDAYNKIGIIGMEQTEYKKTNIDKAVKRYNIEQAEKLRFSPEVLKDIADEFELNIYIPKNEIKRRLQSILNEHSLDFKVTQKTIEDYYGTAESNSKNEPSYKLLHFKFK